MAITIVSYGAGVDSTAVLVGMHARGERPDGILFADTGSEKPQTYDYLITMNAWLISVGFPRITVVKNASPIAHDKSLGEECLRKSVLPSLAYRKKHSCSLKWKVVPQDKYLRKAYGWNGRRKTWAHGTEPIVRVIGYDAGKNDTCRRYKAEGKARPGFVNRYPLIEWGWDREECKRQIAAAGLPVPVKSACFFCPASQKSEVEWLAAFHPELAATAVLMETKAHARGLRLIKGLGGCGSWSWTEHLRGAAAAAPAPADDLSIPAFLRRAA